MTSLITPVVSQLEEMAVDAVTDAASRVGRAATRSLSRFGKRTFSKVGRRSTSTKKRPTKRIQDFRALATSTSRPDAAFLNRSYNVYNLDVQTFSLNSVELMSPLAEGASPDQRRGNRILLKDVKINYYLRHLESGATTLQEYWVDFAVLTPKNRDTVGNLNFFRDLDNQNNVDFVNQTGSQVLNPWNRHTRPINADYYIVHHHSRRHLGGKGQTTMLTDGNRLGTIQKTIYLPMNSIVTYSNDSLGNEVADQKIFFVYWMTQKNGTAFNPVTAPTAVSSGLISYEAVIRFSNLS